jgi:cell division septation protein DedD
VKERLTGAIILVVLIVLLVPELLSGPSRSTPAPQAAVSSTEEPPLRSYTINLADDSHGASPSAGSSSATPQASGPAQPTSITDTPPAVQATDPDAATASTSTADNSAAATQNSTPHASSSGESWQDQPKAAAPHGPTSQQSGSAATSRAAAQQRSAASDKAAAQQRLAVAGTADRPPNERSEPPERTSPSARPSDRASASDRTASGSDRADASGSAGGWVVQLGVFSVQANAERLAQELKSQGFHALVSPIGGAGRPLWRVRAGPVAEHIAAEQLSMKLRAAGHAGSVVPK